MDSIPLHPMIVHFPIVLSVMLPLFALGAIWLARRDARLGRLWVVPFAIAVLVAGSGFAATKTGEAEEERVERVVPEQVLHQHEEAAERFLAIALVVGVIAAVGFARGVVGSAARLITVAGSLVVLFMGFQVGKAGGELVYEHNAGAAYAHNNTQEVEHDQDDDRN